LRCIYAMINGSMEMLDARPDLNSAQIDGIWTTCLGFPRWRGGPLYQAALMGWRQVAAALDSPSFNRTIGPKSERLRLLAEAETPGVLSSNERICNDRRPAASSDCSYP
jgi:3-hydroxyacyl-CoA dehydrogenase